MKPIDKPNTCNCKKKRVLFHMETRRTIHLGGQDVADAQDTV
jgi:hypothetical protein